MTSTGSFFAAVALTCLSISCGDNKSTSSASADKSSSKPTATSAKSTAKASSSGLAPSAGVVPTASSPASASTGGLPDGPMPASFVRQRPDERTSVDACAFIGGLGMSCLTALLEEKDPVKRRYMLRLSDADARQSLEQFKKGEPLGVAHAEVQMFCADSGPCKQKDAEGNELDDGYACLTKAQQLTYDKDPAAEAAHKRACECDYEHAQIPVMGGFLACDAKDKPATRGNNLTLEEANDIRACGECDNEKGIAACQREIDRLKDKDLDLAIYLKGTHVPRCAAP